MLYLLRSMFVFAGFCLLMLSMGNVPILSIGIDFPHIIPVSVLRESNELCLDLKTTPERKCLLRHWVHSHEEDTKEVAVYRSIGYGFPRSRGRVGFNLMKDGKLVYYGISHTDLSLQSSGRWTFLGRQNRLKMNLDNEGMQPFELEIVSCNEEMLKINLK
jgi:hypothetical protein